MNIVIYICLGVFAFMLLYIWAQYNRFISLKNHIKNSWANIDTELKRRYDLIPNLVSVVKAYAQHERELFESVVEWRNRCQTTHLSAEDQGRDERVLVGKLQSLMAVAENYPQLKADQQFLSLQRELSNTEDRIQAARRFYNGNVRDYEDLRQRVPTNLIAQIFGFASETYFEVDSAVRELPKLGLS